MELADKKLHIMRCIKLGMDTYSAQIVAQCTEEEIAQLENDPEYLNEVRLNQKILERALLGKHAKARDIALVKGSTHGIEWMLEKVNPERFARGGRETLPGSGINIYLPAKEEVNES